MSYAKIRDVTVFHMGPDEPCDHPDCTRPHAHIIIYSLTDGDVLMMARCDDHYEILSDDSVFLDDIDGAPKPGAN